MTKKYDLIVSIVNYNGEKFISKCFELLIKACRNSQKEVLIICTDNSSFDTSKEIITTYQDIEKIFLKQNIGYAAAQNQILTNYDAKYFLLLNPDTQIEDENNLIKMLKYMDDNPEIAMATCTTLDENHNLMPSVAHQPTLTNGFFEQLKFKSGFRYSLIIKNIGSKLSNIFPIILNNYNQSYNNITEPLKVKFIYGAYLFLRKSSLEEIGYFDENFFLFWEEIDLCIRARELKYAIGVNQQTFVIHKYQKSQTSVSEFSYYWRVASYFWIFKKYHPFKLIIWSISTGILQILFFVIKLIKTKGEWVRVHYYLFKLSTSFGKKYKVLMDQIKLLYPKKE